ncbi:MAG: DoxX family protein [Deltaproteobacteria bacterium]|nr:DoxX family protein [Deltaproteobacteria bacterium]
MNTTVTTRNTNTVTRADEGTSGAFGEAARRAVGLVRAVEPYAQSALLLALRCLYGGLFAQTGWGKLMNFERTTGFFESLGLPAPALMAALVATTELTGGILLALGAGARVAAAALATVMITAFATAHAEEAFASVTAFTEQPPFPFLVATLIVAAFGAGRISIDGWVRARGTRACALPRSRTAD